VQIKSKLLAKLVASILMSSCAERPDVKFYYPTIKKSEVFDGEVEVSQQVSFAEVDSKWKTQFVVYINLQNRKLDFKSCEIDSYSLNFKSEFNTQTDSVFNMNRDSEKLSFIGGKAFISYIGQVNSPENFKTDLHFKLNEKCGTKSMNFDHRLVFKPKKKKVSFLDRAFFGD